MRWTKLDGDMMRFDRASNRNVMYAGDCTPSIERHALRSLQVERLTARERNITFTSVLALIRIQE